MAKWIVRVALTGYADMEVEADSYDEACEEALVDVGTDMVHVWDYDIDYCDREDD